MAENKLVCVIRIHGKIGLKKKVEETLDRLRIKRKYSCTIVGSDKKELMGMIKSVRDFAAYGGIKENTLKKLIESRAQPLNKSKKINSEEIVKGIKSGKKFSELGIKGFFRLHPPRKGINSKLHFPKGVLGDNKEKINDLIGRML